MIRNHLTRFMRYPEGEEGAGGGGTTTTTRPAAQTGAAEGEGGDDPDGNFITDPRRNTVRPVTEYERELRKENAKTRTKNKEIAEKASTLESELATTKKEGEKAVKEAAKAAQEETNQKFIKREVKKAAIEAGIIDPDDLSLANLTHAKVDDEGEITGVEKVIEELKEKKPHLFKKDGATSQTQPAPKPGEASKAKPALEIPKEEYGAAKRAFLKNGGR